MLQFVYICYDGRVGARSCKLQGADKEWHNLSQFTSKDKVWTINFQEVALNKQFRCQTKVGLGPLCRFCNFVEPRTDDVRDVDSKGSNGK